MAASLGPAEVAAGINALNSKAEDLGNRPDVEWQWAEKAFAHAEVHFNLLLAAEPKLLKLTKHDDDVYNHFRKLFPDMPVDKIKEDSMKSAEGKAKWRPFCEKYKGVVDDYNMGTLLRLDCQGEYSEENTTLAPKVQFLAIEIARNREGFNSGLSEKFKKSQS